MGQTVAKQYRSVSTLALLVLAGVAATACGGRTLETAANAEDGAEDDGAASGGNGFGGNGFGGNGFGGNGNGNNGNGNNGNGNVTVVTTGADTTTGGGGGPVSVVTSTDGTTMGGMLGPSACDAPYDLGTAVGHFSGVSMGPSTFLSSCGGDGSETFLLWTAPETGTYRLNTFGSEIDTVLSQLLQPNCESLGIVQCNDDINGTNDSEILLYAVAGEVLTFVVDSFETGGRFELEIVRSDDSTEPCGPILEELTGVGSPLVNRFLPLNDDTLHDDSTDQCHGMAPRVTFGWTAPNDGTFSFDTMGSNYDTVLVLRTSCDDTVGRVCNDDGSSVTQSLVSLPVWAGQSIRVEVATFDGTFATNDGDDPRITLNVRQQ